MMLKNVVICVLMTVQMCTASEREFDDEKQHIKDEITNINEAILVSDRMKDLIAGKQFINIRPEFLSIHQDLENCKKDVLPVLQKALGSSDIRVIAEAIGIVSQRAFNDNDDYLRRLHKITEQMLL